jgi:hypothetical protein
MQDEDVKLAWPEVLSRALIKDVDPAGFVVNFAGRVKKIQPEKEKKPEKSTVLLMKACLFTLVRT